MYIGQRTYMYVYEHNQLIILVLMTVYRLRLWPYSMKLLTVNFYQKLKNAKCVQKFVYFVYQMLILCHMMSKVHHYCRFRCMHWIRLQLSYNSAESVHKPDYRMLESALTFYNCTENPEHSAQTLDRLFFSYAMDAIDRTPSVEQNINTAAHV